MTYRTAQRLAAQLSQSECRTLIGCHIAFQLMAVIGLVIIIAVTATGCTENTRARTFGGNMTLDLPAGQKLESVTWKGADLWYCTRQMRPDETPETHTFKEKSVWGTYEGTITFQEYADRSTVKLPDAAAGDPNGTDFLVFELKRPE